MRQARFLGVTQPLPRSRSVGRNISFEVRAGNSYALFQRYANELIALKVDVIVSGGSATRAATLATSTTPIVFYYGGDPVRDGFVASLAKPGANATGLIVLDRELDVKRVELLREFLPGVRKVAVLKGSVDGSPRSANERLADEEMYASLAIQPLFFNVQTAADYEAAIGQAARQGVEAVVIRGIYFPNGPDIAALASAIAFRCSAKILNWLSPVSWRRLLPIWLNSLRSWRISLTRSFVERNRQTSQSSNLPDLKCASNARTAAALSVPIPRSVRVSATRIVE